MSELSIIDLAQQHPVLSVGAVSADLMHLADECDILASAGVKMLHFDVMDGVFVPQLTIGPGFVKPFGSRFLRDVHLMVVDPIAAIPQYAVAGADCITVHVESAYQVHKALTLIGNMKNVNNPERKILRGVAILPSTSVSSIEPFLEQVDIVYVVTVDPGYAPAVFAESTERRVGEIRSMFSAHSRRVLLGIDGAITRTSIERVAQLSPDIVVSGSAVFEGRNIAENVAALTSALNR